MSGGNSYPISSEYQKILRDNLDFFEEVLNLYPETGLGFIATDADSQLHAEVRDDGNLSLKFVIALDNNFDRSDGRLFLEDEFVYDTKNREFQRYQRRFSLDESLPADHPFRDYQKKLAAAGQPDADQSKVFAEALFQVRPRPMDKNWLQIFQKHSQDYETVANSLSGLADGAFGFSQREGDHSYSLLPQEEGSSLILRWATRNESEAGAGPVFLQEKYLFDPKTGLLKDSERVWKMNPDFPGREDALKWVEELNQASTETSGSAQELFYDLAENLFGAGFRVPFEKETSVKVLSAHYKEYAVPLVNAVQAADKNWIVKALDPESGIQIRQWDGGRELTVTLVVQNGLDPSQARLKVHDRFFLDAEGHLTGYHRDCLPEDQFQQDRAISKKAAAIAAAPAGADEVLAALATELLPYAPKVMSLPTSADYGAKEAKQALFEINGEDLSLILEEILEKGSPQAIFPASSQGLKYMGSLALEQLAKEKSASQAWMGTSPETGFGVQQRELEILFQKALELAELHPERDPLSLLSEAGNLTKTSSYVERLKRNLWIQKINDVTMEPDPESRTAGWLNIATVDLWDAELAGTAKMMTESLSGNAQQQERAEDFLAVMAGSGTWAARGEYLSPKILHDLGDPWMVGGMMAAPLAGAATEAGLLARFGKSRKYLAFAAGIGMEAGTFTAISDVGQSFKHDPAEVWKPFGWQTLSTALMFTLLRGSHQMTGRARAAMAEGSWGTRWGGKMELPAAAHWPRTANGSYLTAKTPQLAQLTTSGKILSGAMNHSAGISAMWLSQMMAGAWMPHLPKQDWRGGLFDAILGYGHAMMGYRMADALSLGGLHRSLGQIRMDIQEFDTSFPKSQKIESDALEAHLENVLQRRLQEGVAGWQEGSETPFQVSIPLKELLLTQGSGNSRLDLEWQYDPETHSFKISESSRSWAEGQETETNDPSWIRILKGVKDLSLPAPEKPVEASPTASRENKEDSMTRAEEILEQIEVEYKKGKPDLEHITELFRRVSVILEIGSRGAEENEGVDPQTLRVVEAFIALAEEKGIDISPPEIVRSRALETIKRISSRSDDVEREKVDTLADPNPEESGEYVGVLIFSGGDPIDIRLGQPEKSLYNGAGKEVGKVWAGEQEGKVFIAVEVVDGEKIIVNGQLHPKSWLYPVENPVFSIGGREYRLFQPIEDSGSRSITGMEATEIATTAEAVAASVEITSGTTLGYESWLQLEKTAKGLEVAEQLPEKFFQEEIPWINFHAHRGRSESNHGVANIYRAPRILVGAHPGIKEGHPPTSPFQVTSSDGNIANDQALVFLDRLGYINVVRLVTPHESQTVYIDGKEIPSEKPVRVYRNSVIELQGLDGARFQLDLMPHEDFLEQFSGPITLDTQARIEHNLDHPDTTSITSAQARLAERAQVDVAELPEIFPAEENSGLSEDTYFGKSLAEPRDGTLVAPPPAAPDPGQRPEWDGVMPEVEVPDFTALSRVESKRGGISTSPKNDEPETVVTTAPPEDSMQFHISVDEGSQPKDKPEHAELPPEDYFDLPEDGVREDSMAGFDASFALEGSEAAIDAADNPATTPSQDPKFGEELDNLRARFSIRFGRDPLANAEPLLEKPDQPIQKIMVDGAIKSVEEVIEDLTTQLSAPVEIAERPAEPKSPPTVLELFGTEAAVLQKAYLQEFGSDPFEGAEAASAKGKGGKTIQRVKVDDRTIDLDAYLERLAISLRRQVKERQMAEANSPGSRLAQLAKIWDQTFSEPLIDQNTQKVIFDEGQPAAVKDLETKQFTSIEDFIASKEARLEQGFDRAEREIDLEDPDPADSTPRARWIDRDASLAEHIAYVESELGISIGEARLVEAGQDEVAAPEPIEELETGQYQVIETLPPPPPMGDNSPSSPEELLSPVDLEAAQADFDQRQTVRTKPVPAPLDPEIRYSDVLDLINPNDKIFSTALRKAQVDIKMTPNRPSLDSEVSVRGRANDALGFLDQLRSLVKTKDPQETRLATLVVLDHLQESLAELYQSSQDFALVSDGAALTVSTFLTEGTKSVKGDMGRPAGQLVIPFHADQSKAMMLRSVMGLLKKAQIPIEVTIPLNYPSEGMRTIVVRYSDPFVAGVFSAVNDMMADNPKFFADHSLFMASHLDWPGEPISQASHYRLDPDTEESPLAVVKRLLIDARDEVKEIAPESKRSVFKLKVYEGLKKLGWI